MDKVIYKTPTVVIPLDLRDQPEGFNERMDAYGVGLDEFLHFLFDNYVVWEQSTDVRHSKLGWFLNQMGFQDGYDASKQDVVGNNAEWFDWDTTITTMDDMVGFVKNQVDFFLRHMGFMPPRWPDLFLERTVAGNLVLTIVPHFPGVSSNAHAHVSQSHRS